MSDSELHRVLFENSSDAIMLLDTNGFFDCNPATLDMFGCNSRDEFLSKHPSQLSPDMQACGISSEQLANERIGHAFEHGSNQFEWIHKKMNGSTFDAEVWLTSYKHNNETALQATVRDISQRKYLEKELNNSHATLEEKVRERTQKLEDEIEIRHQAESQLRKLSLEDDLTRIGNRRYIIDRLNHAISLAERNNSMIALLFLDIDDFKNINDSLGHDIGDKILIKTAKRLQITIRRSDSIGRLGGDEFAIIVEFKGDDKKDVLTVAHKIFQALAAPITSDNHKLFIKVSIGVSFFPEDAQTTRELLERSDLAMYKAKKSQCGVSVYSNALHEKLTHKLRLGNDLRHALERNELRLMLQPKVSLSNGIMTGAEALIRWDHPELGTISPFEFIPIAEGNGLIIPIGDWVIRESCRMAKKWRGMSYWQRKQGSRCTSLIHIVLGNVGAMKTPMDCFDSISPKALIYQSILSKSWMRLHGS